MGTEIRQVRVLAIILVAASLTACKTFQPTPLEDVGFLERIQSDGDDDVTVRIAVLSKDESRLAFGTDLAKEGIQPVWLEIDNHMDSVLYLNRVAVDPDYFAPLEAAYYTQGGYSAQDKQAINVHFDRSRFHNPILGGEVSSGFLFCNLDEGLKYVNIELVGRNVFKQFEFIVRVPGLVTAEPVDINKLYQPAEIVDCDDPDAFRSALEALPPCTTNKDGTKEGDPITFFLVGNNKAIRAALVRRNWHAAEVLHGGSAGRSIDAFLTEAKYRYMPVSPLYYFGRPQDGAAQKIRENVHERNHLRFWLTPIRYKGESVWAGAISRDIGVKMTAASWYLMTHRIDGDMDEVRSYLGQDLMEANAVEHYGAVRGGHVSTLAEPRMNLTGDPWFTDGLRLVLFISSEPIAPDKIRVVDWVLPQGDSGEGMEELVDPTGP